MSIASCKYAVGQRVEVLGADFDTPGFPQTWQVGTVAEVYVMNEKRGLWYVEVQRDNGAPSTQVVGPRGGNKYIRAVA